jgi:hypothetical protein
MSSIPLPALAIQNNQQSPLAMYAQLQQLKNAQFQQQLQPLQLQREQQATQAGAVDLQMKELGLKNSQVAQGVLSDPNFEKDFSDWRSSKGKSAQVQPIPNTTPGAAASAMQTIPTTVPLHPLAQYLAEKKGLSMFGPGGALEISQTLTAAQQKQAELLKSQGDTAKTALENAGKQYDNFDNIAEPVLSEKDPKKQMQALADMKSEMQENPSLYPPILVQHLDKISTPESLQAAANTSKVHQMIADNAKKDADAAVAQQKVIPAGGGLSPEGQEKVNQDIAVATNPQIQQGKVNVAAAEGAARANVEALMARGSNAALANVPPHLITPATEAATKAGTEYAQAQSVSERLNKMMDAAKKGNVVSYQLLPQEGALQLTTSQGVHRINMAEIQNYGGGSLWQKMEGHLGKQLTGKSIPESVLNDMAEMQKIQAEGAQTKYENSLKTINQNFGSDFKPVEMSGLPQSNGVSSPKVLSRAAIQQAAKDHGVSEAEAEKQAKSAGYTIK